MGQVTEVWCPSADYRDTTMRTVALSSMKGYIAAGFA